MPRCNHLQPCCSLSRTLSRASHILPDFHFVPIGPHILSLNLASCEELIFRLNVHNVSIPNVLNVRKEILQKRLYYQHIENEAFSRSTVDLEG